MDDHSTVLENRVKSGQLDFVIDNFKPDEMLFEQKLLRKEHLLPAGKAQRGIYVSYKRNRYYSKVMQAFMDILFRQSAEKERERGTCV